MIVRLTPLTSGERIALIVAGADAHADLPRGEHLKLTLDEMLAWERAVDAIYEGLKR